MIDAWECLVFDAKNQLTEIGIQSFFLSVKLLIVTFMKVIETEVTEKYQFDKRVEPFSKQTSGNFRL